MHVQARRYQPWVYLSAFCAATGLIVGALMFEMDSTLSTDETQYTLLIPAATSMPATPAASQQFAAASNLSAPVALGNNAPANSSVSAPAPAVVAPALINNPAPEQNWKQIQVQNGETLSSIFAKNNFSQAQLNQILALGKAKIKPFLALHAGDEIDVLVDGNNQILKMSTQPEPLKVVTLVQQNDGFKVATQTLSPEVQLDSVSATIQGSLYSTAKKQDISPKLIQQLNQIFGAQINFSKDLHAGDHFTLIYQNLFAGPKEIGLGDVVAAEITTKGKVYQAVRYKAPDGRFAYYTPAGKSLQPAFLRYPVNYKRISSTFALHRFNPVLHIVRPHYGVDFAAPAGTPVRAASNGVVKFAATDSGYGRVVMIDHSNGYSTRYAHLSRFAKNLKVGQRVNEGQVIGYVGSTGIATGPHLHYEVRINNKPVNPLTVKLPGAPGLTKKDLTNFLPYANELVLQLDLLSNKGDFTSVPIKTSTT